MKRLMAVERKNQEMEKTIVGLKQEVASLKAVSSQIANLSGQFGELSSTLSQLGSGVKSEMKRGYIRGESDEDVPASSSRRPAKRPRAYVELD